MAFNRQSPLYAGGGASGSGYTSRYGQSSSNSNNNENFSNNTNSPRRGNLNGSFAQNQAKSASKNPTASFMYGDYNPDALGAAKVGGTGNGLDTPGGSLDTGYGNRVQMLGGIRTPGLNPSGRQYDRQDGRNDMDNSFSRLRQRKTPYSSQRHTSGRKQRTKTPRGTPRSNGPPIESLSARKFRERGQRSTGARSRKTMRSLLDDTADGASSSFKSPMAVAQLPGVGGNIDSLALGEDDEWINRWVTIFGFDPAVTTYILSYFENFGDIVEHKNGESNTINIQYATVQEALRARNGQDVKIFNIPIPDRPGIFVGVSSTRTMLKDGILGYEGIPKHILKDGSKRSKVQSPGSRLRRSNSEVHQTPRPAVLDSSSIMEEPRREYNCIQKIIRFLFLGTS